MRSLARGLEEAGARAAQAAAQAGMSYCAASGVLSPLPEGVGPGGGVGGGAGDGAGGGAGGGGGAESVEALQVRGSGVEGVAPGREPLGPGPCWALLTDGPCWALLTDAVPDSVGGRRSRRGNHTGWPCPCLPRAACVTRPVPCAPSLSP